MKKWIVIWIVVRYTTVPCEPTYNKYGIELNTSENCYVSYQDTLMNTFNTEADADTFIWGMTNYPQVIEYSKSYLHTINTQDVINSLYHGSNNVYNTDDLQLHTPRDTINVKKN